MTKNDLTSRLASVLGKNKTPAPPAAANPAAVQRPQVNPANPQVPQAPSPQQSVIPPQQFADPTGMPQQPAAAAPAPVENLSGTNPADAEALDGLLDRLNNLSAGESGTAPAAPTGPAAPQDTAPREPVRRRRRPGEGPPATPTNEHVPKVEEFIPREAANIYEAKLNDSLIAELALKYINAKGEASGQEVSEHLRMPFTTLTA